MNGISRGEGGGRVRVKNSSFEWTENPKRGVEERD